MISTIACLGLLMSACSKGGSSASPEDKQSVTPRAGQPSIPLGAGEGQGLQNHSGPINLKMDAEYAKFLNVLPLDKAVQNNLYKIGSESFIPAGIIIVRANVAVTYKDGNLQSSVLNTTGRNYLMSLHSSDIEIIDAYIIDESLGLSGEPISAGNVRRNTDVISSPDTEPHNTIFEAGNATSDNDVFSSPDTEPEGSIFIDNDRIGNSNQGQNNTVISSPDTEPIGSIFTSDIEDKSGVEAPMETPKKIVEETPAWTWRGASHLPIAQQIALKCDNDRNKIINAIFTELSADEIVYDRDAIISLKCIARNQPIKLYNAILENLNYEELDSVRVLTAINSPLLHIVAMKADRDLGLKLLKNTGTDDLHLKMIDINRAVNLLNNLEDYFAFDSDTKEEVYLSLAKMAAAYKAPSDERYILRPLAKILEKISQDRSALVGFTKIMENRDADNQLAKRSATSLAKVILTTASRYAAKDCKTYHLTSKQETAFKKVLKENTYERMLDWMKKNPTTRALDKDAKRTCDLK